MLLDIGAGIFLAILVSEVSAQSLTFSFVIAGIAFALLPDVDFIYHVFKKGTYRDAHRHREMLHYPLIFIPAGMLLIAIVNPIWSLLFGLAYLVHLVHDSIGIGWGVQWLYPFKKDHFSFLYIYRPAHQNRLPRQWLYRWKNEDIDSLSEQYGDKDWLRNIYLRGHPYAIIELLVLLAAVATLYYVYNM